MADEKNVKLGQFMEFVERADERLDALELGGTGGAAPAGIDVTVTIPVSAWTENTDAEYLAAGFAFRADAAVEGLTEADETRTDMDIVNQTAAKLCGMANLTKPMEGAIRHYAMQKPAAALTVRVRVV